MTTPSASEWIVVDSSGWVEYLGDGPKADRFAPYLELPDNLLLPSIVVYEVYKKLLREERKDLADIFLSQAFGCHGRLIELDLELAIMAARTSLETHLPMADAIIYAIARRYHAKLVTCDAHFAGLSDVTVV